MIQKVILLILVILDLLWLGNDAQNTKNRATPIEFLLFLTFCDFEIIQNKTGFLPIGWTLNVSDCESEFELRVFDVLSKLIEKEFPDRLFLYNQVRTCGYRLDFVIYEKSTKTTIGIEVDGKHHFYADDETYTDDHLERANSLKRGGWIIKYLP